MQLLTVRHVTTYRYRRPVSFGEHRMMLRPRDSYDQRLIEARLDISPEPAVLRWMHDVFGGRQSARTVHFITATLIVLFVLVHIFEVLISGPFNEMRSIITGWFAVRPEKTKAPGSTP